MNKRISLILLVLICAVDAFNTRAQQSNTLFPYPQVPEDTEMNLTERCNYLVYNFWDRCNIKESFSSMQKLDEAFGAWISFMPFASADTVHLAIDRYIASVNKAAPKDMVKVGRMAECWLYCDTAAYYSEELYEPFCEAVVKSKKVGKAEKAVFAHQLKVIQSSALGKRVPGFEFTTPQGEKMTLDDVMASRIVLFFNDPDCIDCRMAKTRLSADYKTKSLVERGLVKIVSIYPGEATEEWIAEASTYPEEWIVGATDDIDMYFELPDLPVLYYLDGRHRVIGKNFGIDELLYAIDGIYRQVNTSTPLSEE